MKFLRSIGLAFLVMSSVAAVSLDVVALARDSNAIELKATKSNATKSTTHKSSVNDSNNAIKVMTWNIQVGSDQPENMNDWSGRKAALVQALSASRPSVLCTQEGRIEQLRYIDKNFPTWSRVGGGRDDGKNAGEFCAIYFDHDNFADVHSGTFWLSTTPDSPKNTWDAPYKRICTYAVLRDRKSLNEFIVFSTHFPVKTEASLKAAKVLTDKIKKLHANLAVVLCGDFNCEPGSEAWKQLALSGLVSVDKKHQKTWLDHETPVACLDSIFTNHGFRAENFHLVDAKFSGRFPSDHFGLCADIRPRVGR